ncbi:MAG: F-type H+-transporting ATPase subunit b [Patescibacteria group bacterium]|nr:F-type H+-transporting ATPase subunit b [Patescibacteria group bacterium]
MDRLIQALGLDVRIMIAQFINFSILVWVLWRFAYRPVLNMLEERQKKIEKGVADAQAAETRLQTTTEESKEIISQARKEAGIIIEEAKKKAEGRYQEIVDKAQVDIKKQIDKEKGAIAQEKDRLIADVKKEISSLLIISLEKFLQEKMDSEADKKIIEKIVKDLA